MKRRLLMTAACLTLAGANQAQAQSRVTLPIPSAPFDGQIAESVMDAVPGTPHRVQAPHGAPNVLVFMSDDVGFGMSSTFGGPVPTPNFEKLAQSGQRYNRFHTTGICSPSRAALLTGRNHHNAGVGYISDISSNYPGYNGHIQADTATIAQILRLNGYNTAMFGKHHNIPTGERSEAGPFDAWPTGLGFEYFYGFPYAHTDQFSPNLYRGIQRVPMDAASDKLLDEMLADDVIRYVHNQKAGDPDKPFLIYLAPGSTHSPHQAPSEYIARFKGKFDKGWDQIRIETWRRQIAAGIIPSNAKLTPRPPELPAWESLSPEEKAFHARTMEVAAAQLAFQDHQFGRIVDELTRMGQFDNTLITVILGDNGASGEGGVDGTINELRSMAGPDGAKAWHDMDFDALGGPMTYQNYSAAWAWGMNAPFPWVKQYANMLGGIRNGMILSWNKHADGSEKICEQFGHLVDIAPTILDAASIPAPETVLGTGQKPMDGQSLLPSLSDCQAGKPRTQYFEMGGKIGLYSDGWFLSGEDGRLPWENLPPVGVRPTIKWTLYDLEKDFSQSRDLSVKLPAKTDEMIALFKREARANNVFPLDHRFAAERAKELVKFDGQKQYDFWGKNISIPAHTGPVLMARSFSLTADLDLDSASSSGVVIALGSWFGGWSLYIQDGHPTFTWARSTDPREVQQVSSDKTLQAGKSRLHLRFETGRPGSPATVLLRSDHENLASLDLPVNYLSPAGMGETLDIGRDLGVPVVQYGAPQGAIEGDISLVRIVFD